MSILQSITSPDDIQSLSLADLEILCREIRDTIIDATSTNGGHPASNLGCVELTVAIHRVFDIQEEPLIFDVGHQCYTHKILTGRYARFQTLRQTDGISGFPSPDESKYDMGMSGHSGSAISLASGVAAARHFDGKSGKVIALVGDASLTNGVSLEGLNADAPGKDNLVVILNDNRMSISQNVGNLARCLSQVTTGKGYNRLRDTLRSLLSGGRHRHRIRQTISAVEDSIKGAILPQATFFQSLGFRYIGPVDGHDLDKLEAVLRSIRGMNQPILLHAITQKGHGCDFMERNPTAFHGVSGFDSRTGEISRGVSGFSRAFGDILDKMAGEHPEMMVITPAMKEGSGLSRFAKNHPSQFHDAGIAEEHAVIFAAGLATAGKRPICALYTTFAQRALDCIYSDVILPRLPVLFALDRAGFVNDGPTHHGLYDLGFLRGMPGLDILCPRSELHLQRMVEYAYSMGTPAVIRYPRGGTGTYEPEKHNELPSCERGHAEIIRDAESPQVAIWALGTECATALKTADLLERQGIHALVIDTQWLAPFDVTTARRFAGLLQVTIEDHSRSGGLGDTLNETLETIPHGIHLRFCWPDRIIPHGNASDLRRAFHLTAEDIAEKIALAITNTEKS